MRTRDQDCQSYSTQNETGIDIAVKPADGQKSRMRASVGADNSRWSTVHAGLGCESQMVNGLKVRVGVVVGAELPVAGHYNMLWPENAMN